jgi:hypothetical protein
MQHRSIKAFWGYFIALLDVSQDAFEFVQAIVRNDQFALA